MSATLDHLDRLFPGAAVLNTKQTAEALGKSGKAGDQSIRNQISKGTFPLLDKLRKVGGVWVLPKVALADWLDGKPAQEESEPEKRKVGRPKNADKAAFAAGVMLHLDEWLAASVGSEKDALRAHAAQNLLDGVSKPSL